jgi:iron complex outermembrane receptor protein
MSMRATIWQLNVDNVADKEYWAAGAPRTAKLTFKLDL